MELVFSNCRIPVGNQLGPEGQGFKIAMKTLDGGRIGIAAQALGIAQGAVDGAIAYAKKQIFDGKPVANRQGVQFMLADMVTQVEAARLLVYNAAFRASTGLPYSQESAMAKLYASETSTSMAEKAASLMGDFGYDDSFPFDRFMRDAKITEIYEGTSEIQRLVIGTAVTR